MSRAYEKKQVSAQLFVKLQQMAIKRGVKEDDKKRKEEEKKAVKAAKNAAELQKIREKKKIGDPDKTAKRLKKVLTEKESQSSRLDALKGFFESATDQEERAFFDQNSGVLFQLVNELFLMPSTKKSKYKAKELTPFLEMLKKFVIAKPQMVTKENSPQTKDIERILERCLMPINKHELRLAAFDTLLTLLSLKPPHPEQLLRLFSQVVVLHPFKNSDSWKAALEAKAEQALTLAKVPTLNESILMLEHFFNHVIADAPNEHKFWFQLWVDSYSCAFFPETSPPDKLPPEAFRLCPPEVLYLLLGHLESSAVQRNPLFEDFWQHQDGAYMMAIMRQTCQLPLDWVETSARAIDLYRQWIMKRNEADSQEKQNERRFWKDYIRNMCLTFTAVEAVGDEQLTAHIEHVRNVVMTIGSIVGMSRLDDAVRLSLLLIFLDAVYELLNKHSKTRSPFSVQMCPILTQNLIVLWVLSKSDAQDLWDALGERFRLLTDWRELILVWKEKVLQLTAIVVEQLYTPPEGLYEAPVAPVSAAAVKAALKDPSATLPAKKKDTVPKEPRFAPVQWTKESAYFTWSTIFNLLGDFNRFKNADNFELAMASFSEVVEMLRDAEEQLPIEAEKPIPMLDTWLSGLIETCYLPLTHLRGKQWAYRILHRLFCQRETPIGPETMSHFYRALLRGLRSENAQEVYEVVTDAAFFHLFPLNLPGSVTLTCPFLRCIDHLFQTPSVPDNVLQAGLTIISSFLFYPSHFDRLEYPQLGGDGDESRINGEELRTRVLSTLLVLLQRNSGTIAPHLKIGALWAVASCVTEDVSASSHVLSAREQRLPELISTLLQHTSARETDAVIRTALDALTGLTVFPSYFERNRMASTAIVSRLLENITELLKPPPTEAYKENVISAHFYCLSDFLLALPFILQDDRAFALKAFRAIQTAMNELQSRRGLAGGAAPAAVVPPAADPLRTSSTVPPPRGNTPGTLSASLKDDVQLIKESAEALLTNLLNRHNNFPCPAGADQTSSPVPPEDELDNVLFFLYNESTLFSLYEAVNPTDPLDRTAVVTLRDASGRYTWKGQVHYEELTRRGGSSKKPRTHQKSDSATQLQLPPPPQSDRSGRPPSTALRTPRQLLIDNSPPEAPDNDAARRRRKRGEVPVFSEKDTEKTHPNQLAELLAYVSEVYPECLTEEALRERLTPVPLNDPKIAKQIELLREQAEAEDTRCEWVARSRPRVSELHELTAFERPVPVSNFHACRLLLSHLGLLTPEQMKRFRLIDSGPKFTRQLHALDKASSRENVKIGVIYVACGQEQQYEIFRSQSASRLYSSFVAGLGWLVNLKTHQGFMGGLVANPTTVGPIGTTAYFFADRNTEVIFHEAVRMTTDPKDPTQVEKKMHIGNDIVHIVWSEHRRDYKPTTVTSSFNFAHIVVYPLSNGLFRIQIFRKANVELFGPLQDGMVVPKRLLPLLVRQTALNANRVVRHTQPGYERPFPTRKAMLQKIADSYKMRDVEIKDFLANLFVVPPRERVQATREDAPTPAGPPAEAPAPAQFPPAGATPFPPSAALTGSTGAQS